MPLDHDESKKLILGIYLYLTSLINSELLKMLKNALHLPTSKTPPIRRKNMLYSRHISTELSVSTRNATVEQTKFSNTYVFFKE